MNSNNTHFTIVHDKTKYIFTAVLGICQECPVTDKLEFVITCGTNKNYNNWQYYCEEHSKILASKKRYCNCCNEKSIVQTIPRICQDCITMLIENNSNMVAICKYPNISRAECSCQFCITML